MAQIVSIVRRMEFINTILTQKDVDDKLSHYDRQRLMEEYEELAIKVSHLRKASEPNVAVL